MKNIMIGVDLAKNVLQLHEASRTGEVLFRKKLSRRQFLGFMQSQPTVVVVIQACGSVHYWARELMLQGMRSS